VNLEGSKDYHSHGSGAFELTDFRSIGRNVNIERGVLVFNPGNIALGNNVYIGHNTILKGYHKNEMVIGNDTWIGQICYFHSAGGIEIGRAVGIGPGVKILTSVHGDGPIDRPIIFNELDLRKVVIEDGCDIGIGAIILPGVRIGEGAIVGAGAIVNRDVEAYSVVVGNPAKLIRKRR